METDTAAEFETETEALTVGAIASFVVTCVAAIIIVVLKTTVRLS